ncbi:protein argonaute 2-like [Juglans microcarpa x Juglans regia]|uniref:protein argonaute 2-like n=1 Tax=Juglans microcarpa x Juglans regia TaxID=2249226 RepID=UPI001B7F1F95|nr:protein argonaute 2-like [Juglans microcarpa x Juglans regia]
MERGGGNRGRGRGRDGGGRGGRGGRQQHQQWRGSRPGGPWDRQPRQPQGDDIVASGPPMGQVVESASLGGSGEGSSSAAGRGVRGPAWRGGAGQIQWEVGSTTPTAAAPPVQRPPQISPEPIPDPVVSELQAMSISEKLTTPPEDSNRILPVKRPDKGGALAIRTSRLRVNHFPVNFTPETVIMHYDLDVKLEVPLKNRRPVRISKADLSVVRNKLSSDDPVRFPMTKTAYDGEKNIFSAVSLPTGKFNVKIAEGEDTKGGSYVVTIKLVNELKLCKLEDYLRGHLSSIPRDILQGLDLVMKENPARNMISVGRSFFPREPREGDDLGCGIMASRGFQHSLKQTSQGLAMCLDYSVLAFRKRLPVIDFLREHIYKFDILNFQKFRADVVGALKDLKVTVTHRKTKQKYIIKGLTSENTRRISFDEEDPEGKNPTKKVSIVDYFLDKYGKDIRYKDIPCLDLGKGKKKNYVPMEFCILFEGQRFPKEDLDRNAAIMLKNMSLVRPNDREREICSMVRSKDGPLGGGIAQNFGMAVNMNMTKVTGRIIGPPELKLGASNGKVIKVTVEKEKCQWNLVGKSVVEGKRIDRWGVIDFSSSERSGLNPDFFIPKLINRCGNLGIRMEEPLIYECTTMWKFSRLNMLCELLESIKKEAYRICKGNLQILLCVMSRRDPGYKYLKWISETQLGIVTQCCLSTCANKANDQYLANLAIKINAKLGGSNVELNNPLPRFEGKGHVMFVGADVNHPAARNTISPSIAAVVATMNWPAANRYVARVRPQVHRKETILNFGDMCLELVERYAQLNNVRPDKIVIFRDGVSESQFDMVLNEELQDLKRALQAIKYSPSITLIVAQKRHQTRFFPESARDGCSTGNVSPGTVVDTIIVHPFEFDFYLCSHFGSLGTSKPTHYHVLWDDHRFTSDQLQKLIYELCFTFARCTKPVSLVPPVYYADLVAYRGRLYYEAMIEGRSPVSTSSASSSSSSSSLASFDQNFFKLHASLENIMFFV